MEAEQGPIYGVTLIRDLPISGGMRQAMPSRKDLVQAERNHHTRVVAGYEVLLAHYQEADAQRRAVQAVAKWGIYAVPCGDEFPQNKWRPRMSSGDDPPAEFCIFQTTYPSWESAVLELAGWLEARKSGVESTT